jgi:hypothetical protein
MVQIMSESNRDPDAIRDLIRVLLDGWEYSLRNADTLRLILQDCCPDWKAHYATYADDPGVQEHVNLMFDPMRKVADATLRGEIDYLLIEQVLAELKRKPS